MRSSRGRWGSSAWRKSRFREDLITLNNSLAAGCRQVGVSPLCHVTTAKTGGHSLKFHQGSFRLNIRKNSLTGRVIKHWNRQSGAVVVSQHPEVPKGLVDVALGNKDLIILEVFSSLNKSMIP